MIDDLRNSAETAYIEEETQKQQAIEPVYKPKKGPFLGMTASQRFIISLFLFLMVVILGVFLLILFQKVYPTL